jgi:aminopeptidase N
MRRRIFASLILLPFLGACQELDIAQDIGDPYAPGLGNPGYDALHYAISLRYDPLTNDLAGSTTIDATAIQTLESFDLDFRGLEVDSVQVDGSPATYSRTGRELIVTPADELDRSQPFRVRITYHGAPGSWSSSLVAFQVGWFRAEDGSVNVMNFPDGAETWFPSNDHPLDKATYRFEITVPEEWFVLGPGSLVASLEDGGLITYIYEMAAPMATTSAALHIDTYETVTMPPVGGVEPRAYFPAGTPDALRRRFEILPEALAFLADALGPYPFDTYSVVIADPSLSICADGLANSEQTVVLHCPTDRATSEGTIVHELAHQWFGLSVATVSLGDAWLCEGPATYMGWMWMTREGELTAIDGLARAYEIDYSPQLPIGEPPLDNISPREAYVGGALLLHALRLQIGEEAFFASLSTFLERYRYGNAETSDFIEVAEEISGQDLQDFFDAWLHEVPPPHLPGPPG